MISAVILILTIASVESPKALAFAMLCHEMSHVLLGLVFFHALPRLKISLGGLRLSWDFRSRLWENVLVSLSGPMSNFLMWVFLPKCSITSAYSLSLAIFNLLPIGGLDGGEIIKNLTEWLPLRNPLRWVAKALSALSVFTVFFLCCYASLVGEFNLTLLLATLYLIIRTYGN